MVIIDGVESVIGDPGLLANDSEMANDLANYLSDGQSLASVVNCQFPVPVGNGTSVLSLDGGVVKEVDIG